MLTKKLKRNNFTKSDLVAIAKGVHCKFNAHLQ